MFLAPYTSKARAERRLRKSRSKAWKPAGRVCKIVGSDVHSRTTFVDLLHNNDIRAEITGYLDTKDFLSLACTTFSLRQSLRADRWDINRKLSRFFRDPIALRNLQARTNAIVSGPFALGFAEGKTWKDSYPVIWVHKEYRDKWLDYLSAEGYVSQSQPSIVNQFRTEYSDATDSVSAKWTFKRSPES